MAETVAERLTKAQLLGSFVRRYRDVETIAGTVRIRNLTEGEKSEFEAGAVKDDGKLNLSYVRTQRRKLICLVLVDTDGEPLLDAGDAESLKALDAAVTGAIFAAATDHCGFSREEAEELKKNYAEASGVGSPTD